MEKLSGDRAYKIKQGNFNFSSLILATFEVIVAIIPQELC